MESNADVILGNKQNFAIQIGYTKDPPKFKMCFWVNSKKIGTYTKGGELRFAIASFYSFWKHKETFFLPVLEKMTPQEIDKYLVRDMFELGDSDKPKDKAEYELRKSFGLFFGPQFSNDGSTITVLYQDHKVRFVYVLLRKKIFFEHHIDEDAFKQVFEELIKFEKSH